MVIVGAGISAIAAANLLISEGINDVVILEATDRVGGRIYSIDLGMFTRSLLLNHGPVCCRMYAVCTGMSLRSAWTSIRVSFLQHGFACETNGV